MTRVCIIQPILTNYCLPVFTEMSGFCQVDLIYSPSAAKLGFGDVAIPTVPGFRCFVVPTFKPLGQRLGMIQWGIAKYVLRERPDAIIASANPRYLSFWATLILGKLLGIPVYAHGHGLFKKHKIGVLYRLMTAVLLRLVTSYICYAPIVRQSFIDHGFSDQKLSVAHNSLINRFPVQPFEKTGNERGILFVGRLRKGSNVELLVRVLDRMRRDDCLPLALHVIGTGEEAHLLQKVAANRSWIVLHGETYDQEQIREISLNCFLGCYPGNAGLSVVHMMSLSLPVVTHDDLRAHGPEPSFLRHGVSGMLYDHRNPEESLYQAIKALATDPVRLARMRQAAFEDYKQLVDPPLATRFWSIISEGRDDREAGSITAQACTSKPSTDSLSETKESSTS